MDDFDEILEEFRYINSLPNSRARNFDLVIGQKAVLKVKSHTIVTANFSDESQENMIGSQVSIILNGTKTGNSVEVNKAYIISLNPGEDHKQPIYSKERKTIYLWISSHNLEGVLKSLHEPKKYCWIKRFGDNGDSIYADFHTQH